MLNRSGVNISGEIGRQYVVRAVPIFQQILRKLEKRLLKPAAREAAPKIDEVADAAFGIGSHIPQGFGDGSLDHDFCDVIFFHAEHLRQTISIYI